MQDFDLNLEENNNKPSTENNLDIENFLQQNNQIQPSIAFSNSHDVESQEKNLFNTFIIEKDKKSYKLTISKIDKDIIIKCRIEKPLKVFEKKFTKSDLEKLGKIFKGCDNIEEAYTYIINSLENKQYIFEETEKEIKIKLNNINIFEFKEIILPEKEIDSAEKIENLYNLQDDLVKEINNLKIENEKLKKEIESIKTNTNTGDIPKNELIDVKLTNGSDFGSGFLPFKVYKLSNNIVKMNGLINCTFSQTICTLPENCRPKGQLIFVCMASSGALRVDICENGNVLPSGSGSGWLSLDNICFIPGV